MLTVALAVVCGVAAAVVALPYARDWLLLRDLASPSAGVRSRAILRAVQRAIDSPRTVRSLVDHLDTPDDTQFAAIAAALKRLGQFSAPGRNPLYADRVRAIELESIRSQVDPNGAAAVRELILGEVILCGRDSAYVRRALAAASADPSGPVRARSAVLAARLGDDHALAALLKDADPNVVAAAALDAGIAGRRAQLPRIREILGTAHDIERLSAAALAMARLDPNGGGERLAGMLAEADAAGRDQLRDRLLHVMTILRSPRGDKAVLDVLAGARRAGRPPPAAALVAAGKLRLQAAGDDARAVLAAAVRPGTGVLVGQTLAAIEAAKALDSPVRGEAEAICRELWSARWPLLCIASAELLGKQTAADQPGRNAPPTRQACEETLRLAATYEFVPPPTTGPATGPATAPAGMPSTGPASTSAPASGPSIIFLRRPRNAITTPTPSAAAAVAIWHLQAEFCDEFVGMAAGQSVTLPGDYVAWHIGLERSERAFRLGLAMLPAVDAPPAQRVYNDNIRAAGALLLAIAARDPQQRVQAAKRVRSRLVGDQLGAEDDFHIRGAYRCALAVLGQDGQAEIVHQLLETGEFSQRRAIAALTLAGRLDGLDWLLWNPQVDETDTLFLLIDELLNEVLAGCTALPTVDGAADGPLRTWQLRILRDTYAVERSGLQPHLRGR